MSEYCLFFSKKKSYFKNHKMIVFCQKKLWTATSMVWYSGKKRSQVFHCTWFLIFDRSMRFETISRMSMYLISLCHTLFIDPLCWIKWTTQRCFERSCLWCHGEEETDWHAFVGCEVARELVFCLSFCCAVTKG